VTLVFKTVNLFQALTKFQVSGFKSYCGTVEHCVAGDQHKKALVGHVAIEVAEFDFGGALTH
jgi:hypothetical protein